MGKKEFFQRRTEAQIKKLKVKPVSRARGLVERIDKIDPAEEGIIIRTQLLQGEYFRNSATGADASRKALKWGERGGWIQLDYPTTIDACVESRIIPLQIRERDFALAMKDLKEEEIPFVGYVEQPRWGDRMKRVTPFVHIPIGVKLFSFAEQSAAGIEVDLRYVDAKRVAIDGAEIPVSVPSRTEKKSRYAFRLTHVPIVRSAHNLATILRMKPLTEVAHETGEAIEGRTEHERYLIRYPREEAQELGPVIWRYPHDVAAYLGIIKSAHQELKSLAPMEMNPFSLFGKRAAKFYDALNNNVLIYDPTLESEDKLRHLHLAEQSILWARAIKVIGFNEFGFWNWNRDGALKTYWENSTKK